MDIITERQVIGWFYEEIANLAKKVRWVEDISVYSPSNQASEKYGWLGMPPSVREWKGNRHITEPSEYSYEITNKLFEATMDFAEADLTRDKTGQIKIRIAELAARAFYHWAQLLSTAIIAGEATDCYDGDYFFDTDHSEGGSGTQDNDLTGAAATGTIPTIAEFRNALYTCITQMQAFKDDQGELINQDAQKFIAMVPPIFYKAAIEAVSYSESSAGFSSPLFKLTENDSLDIRIESNNRLAADWTDTFAVFRTDGHAKPFIRQEEVKPRTSAMWLGSEYHHRTRRVQVGIDMSRNVGYGLWQHACLYVFT